MIFFRIVTKQRSQVRMTTKTSACDYLSSYYLKHDVNFSEFIQIFNILSICDIEKLIIHAISYNNVNILNALFDEHNGYSHELQKVFEIHINSLYSADISSLVPSIKTDDNIALNLFSQATITDAKNIEFANQIIQPTTSTISNHILNHLMCTNGTG